LITTHKTNKGQQLVPTTNPNNPSSAKGNKTLGIASAVMHSQRKKGPQTPAYPTNPYHPRSSSPPINQRRRLRGIRRRKPMPTNMPPVPLPLKLPKMPIRANKGHPTPTSSTPGVTPLQFPEK
jgi:hypothetical protein